METLITDAYATVALAHRRAAAVYTSEDDMKRLGTAAVHIVTIATSYMATRLDDTGRNERTAKERQERP